MWKAFILMLLLGSNTACMATNEQEPEDLVILRAGTTAHGWDVTLRPYQNSFWKEFHAISDEAVKNRVPGFSCEQITENYFPQDKELVWAICLSSEPPYKIAGMIKVDLLMTLGKPCALISWYLPHGFQKQGISYKALDTVIMHLFRKSRKTLIDRAEMLIENNQDTRRQVVRNLGLTSMFFSRKISDAPSIPVWSINKNAARFIAAAVGQGPVVEIVAQQERTE